MSKNLCESFNGLEWHDSKLRSLRILRNENDLDEVHLELELRGMDDQEFTEVTCVFEDAVFFLCDMDLQGKRECADDISSATCLATSGLMIKLQNERLKFSPDALSRYLHFRIYLIPPGGTIDVIATDFQIEVLRLGLSIDGLGRT